MDGLPVRDCFQTHLREAIALNQSRRPIYERWSDGASRSISRRLIRSERAALLTAWYVDRRARAFQARGLTIGCDEFVTMALTPELPPSPLPPPAYHYRGPPDTSAMRAELQRAYARAGFGGVEAAAERLLDTLAGEPAYHCMLRHLLESLGRIALLAPKHDAAAQRVNAPSPIPLSRFMMRLHFIALRSAARLDRDAAPLQARGIPILCRDVPPIRPARVPDR